MADVRIEKLKKSFGAVEVLKDIDLIVEDGSFVVLVGPLGLRQVHAAARHCGAGARDRRDRSPSAAAR